MALAWRALAVMVNDANAGAIGVAEFVERYVVDLALGLKAAIMLLNPRRIAIGGIGTGRRPLVCSTARRDASGRSRLVRGAHRRSARRAGRRQRALRRAGPGNGRLRGAQKATIEFYAQLEQAARWALALALLACAPLAAEIRSLTILHTNDLHARLSPLEDQQGGFAYYAAVDPARARQLHRLHPAVCRRPGAGLAGLHHLPRAAGLRDRQPVRLRRRHAGQPRVRLRLDAGAQIHPDGQLSHGDLQPGGRRTASCSRPSRTSSSTSTSCAWR